LGEEDNDLPLPKAVARQSFKVYTRLNRLSDDQRQYLERVSQLDSAPDTVEGWQDLLKNVEEFYAQRFSSVPKSS
jgi:hypothetical protein